VKFFARQRYFPAYLRPVHTGDYIVSDSENGDFAVSGYYSRWERRQLVAEAIVAVSGDFFGQLYQAL